MKKRIIFSGALTIVAFTVFFAYTAFNAYSNLKEFKSFTQSGEIQNSIKSSQSLASDYGKLQKLMDFPVVKQIIGILQKPEVLVEFLELMQF